MTGNINGDTICATATAAGMGGIAVSAYQVLKLSPIPCPI
ncbi:Uncharacterised protein [Porphyromonas macacae]|uniref:Uncharacterized protein n=1 Tax=Porphyromonas macacae TaxID=28115 RepID=A0A379EGJ4_9PORP|nr:Uncharacterised protein [Porphyromonas macacae]